MRDSEYSFDTPLMEEGRIEFVTRSTPVRPVELIAYVNGIEIGRSAAITPSVGDRVAIMCKRFPHVNLPVILRFALGEEGPDAAPPMTIRSSLEVARLVGSGTVVNTSLRIADGVLHGTAYNPVNGIGHPALVGRINGLIIRSIQCEKMALRDEGGGRFTYHMRLQPEDLQASGAVFEIVSLPGFETIASMSYERNETASANTALQRLEAAVAMLGKRVDLETARNGHAIERLRKDILSKDDALIEYVMSIAFDAGSEGSDVRDRSSARPKLGEGKIRAARTLRVPPASRWFLNGWEDDPVDFQGVSCRLVDGCGVLLNPHAERNLTRLEFTVLSTAEQCPQIDILFDTKRVPVSIISSNGKGPFSVSAELEHPAAVTLIRIIADETMPEDLKSPIADVTLIYDAEDAAAAPE